MGQSLAETNDDELIRKVQNSVLKEYSSYTIGEAFSKLKCDHRYWYSSPKNPNITHFICTSTEDEELLKRIDGKRRQVSFSASFSTTNGQISVLKANVYIYLLHGVSINLIDVKDLGLGQDELLAEALNPVEKGRIFPPIFPLSNFIKSHSRGRYTDLIDFAEKNNPIRKVQNASFSGFSTTIGDAMNRLKCDNKLWWYKRSKKNGDYISFTCQSTKDEEYLNKSHQGTEVGLTAIFGKVDGRSLARNTVYILVPSNTAEPILINLQKGLNLSSMDVWSAIFNPSEKDCLFPLNDFIKSHSNGRYSDISDFVEKEKATLLKTGSNP